MLTVALGYNCRLVGDVLIWTAFVSYAGPFSLNDRDTLQNSWIGFLNLQNIPYTENANIIDAAINADTVGASVLHSYFYSLIISILLWFNVFHWVGYFSSKLSWHLISDIKLSSVTLGGVCDGAKLTTGRRYGVICREIWRAHSASRGWSGAIMYSLTVLNLFVPCK